MPNLNKFQTRQPTLVDQRIEKIKRDYEALFSSELGQRVLDDIKKSGLVEREIFNSDIYLMCRQEGMRTLALHILYMATPLEDKKQEHAQI